MRCGCGFVDLGRRHYEVHRNGPMQAFHMRVRGSGPGGSGPVCYLERGQQRIWLSNGQLADAAQDRSAGSRENANSVTEVERGN
jgi:hypothetical protein